jgi:hypothetical protein
VSLLSELIAQLNALIEQSRETQGQLEGAQGEVEGVIGQLQVATVDSSNSLVAEGLSQLLVGQRKLEEARALLESGNIALEQYVTGPLLGSGSGSGSGSGGGGGTPPGKPPAPAPPPEPEEPDPRESSDPSGVQPVVEVTRPRFAPDADRSPRGKPANVADTGGNQTDIDRENDAATTLAKAGYDIEQNPLARPNGRRPDYMIDGEWWDCYAPRGTSTRTIHTAIRDKVGKSDADRQADRIILNLDGCSVSPDEIRARLKRSPIRGLQEIKIVKGGKVTQFYPWDVEAEYDGD